MIESVSKRAFRGSSGTYNVHALELAAARERKLKGVQVTVHFLDDTQHTFHVEKRSKGGLLLEQVYQHLELVEKDYFGLQYSQDGSLQSNRKPEFMRWLDPSKTIKKQLGSAQFPLYFRVKFYVSDPSKLQEEYTRYQFYLQLRKDILEGRLQIPPSTAILLASYTAQSELGDYIPEEHGPNYLSHLELVPNQNEDMERKICELHKLHKGQLPADAEFSFLDYAKRIDMYGVDLHKARDNANKDIHLGVTHVGLVVFQNGIRINVFSWSKIMKISFKRKHFFIQLKREPIRATIPAPIVEEKGKIIVPPARPPGPYAHKVTSSNQKEPKKAWAEEPQLSDDDGGFLERTLEAPFSPGIAGRIINFADEEPSPLSPNGDVYDTPPYSANPSPTSQIIDDTLFNITLYPDENCKYGFNVNGGSESNVPIRISRVAADTPADKCTPKMTQGDHLMQINGHDVSHALHQEVVKLIQEARATNEGKSADKGKLVLTLKPYSAQDDNNYGQIRPPGQIGPPSPGQMLLQSMLFIADGLASGSLLTQYELLYRKHPDLHCDESAKPDNLNKNRYRDISPYDTTRVILKNAESGDYINANYVNMEIANMDVPSEVPDSSIVNRYIATQGPLQNTTEDFWQMIIEEECSLIVMLTTLVERGRAKCHKYWPNVEEDLIMPNAIVKCISEEEDPSGNFVFREFTLKNVQTETERNIKHMQYVAWPDHGVPDSPTQFLIFTDKVRAARKDPTPVVVHCSAGIGRTGVLVLMETALCLMEREQPVYPQEIVKQMRKQRAMMIQNASQYKFVCECVYAAYTENILEKEEKIIVEKELEAEKS